MIANEYGNVDIRGGVPDGWVHVKGNNPEGDVVGCDCLDTVEHYAAMVGYTRQEATSHTWRGAGFTKNACWRPRFDGVIVREANADRLQAEIAAYGKPSFGLA